MPAPTPIQIRYGPSGLLGQAVATAAANNAFANHFDQQKADDMQFIRGTQQHANAMQEQAANQAYEANRLQLAHAYATLPQQQQQQQVTGDPNSDALLKSTYLNNAGTDLPPDQAAQFKALIGNRNVSPQEFQNVIFDSQKRNTTRTNEANDAQSKQEFIRSATAGMSPADAAGLSALAGDKSVSLAQIRTAADAIRSRNTVLPRTKLALEAEGLDMQSRQLRSEMDGIARAMGKIGLNPETTSPASLNPTYADPNAATYNTMGVGQSIKDSVLVPGTGSLVKGGQDAETVRAYFDYQKKKKQLQDIIARRQQLLMQYNNPQAFNAMAGNTGQPAPAAPGGMIDIHPSAGFPDAPAGGGVLNMGQPAPAAAGPRPASAMSDAELLQALQQ